MVGRGVASGEAFVGGFVDVVPVVRRIGHVVGASVADVRRFRWLRIGHAKYGALVGVR